MKCFVTLLFFFFSIPAFAQKKNFSIHPISLPPELSWYDNQFSGMYIHKDALFLMSESRLQDKAEPKLYTIATTDLDKKMKDTSFVLPYKKIHIYNLEILRNKMKEAGDDYEGLEAMVIDGNNVYFSVETATPSNNCYLLKGNLSDTAVILYPDFLEAMPKLVNADGSHIYNAGFETMGMLGNHIAAVFEYNYFDQEGKTGFFLPGTINFIKLPFEKLPFRITDMTPLKKDFIAINYFYKGEGDDAVYRVPDLDPNSKLIKDTSGYHNYCRLIDISASNGEYSWKTIWEFPAEYSNYNWEGIAAYKKGYFIINDKYTPKRPYSSTLLYLNKE